VALLNYFKTFRYYFASIEKKLVADNDLTYIYLHVHANFGPVGFSWSNSLFGTHTDTQTCLLLL